MSQAAEQRVRDIAAAQSSVQGGTELTWLSIDVLRIAFPGGESAELNMKLPDWHGAATTLQKTGRLYLLSLQFLLLLEPDLSPDRLSALFSSFADYARTPEYRRWRVNNASWDHCVAMRIETLLALGLRASGDFRHLLSSSVLDDDLDWGRQRENIPSNNHGLMLVQALLLARIVLLAVEDPRARAGDDVLHDAVPRILYDNFADDGWAAENSPIYSRVWYQLIERMLRDYPDSLATLGVANYCADLLDKLTYTTSVQMTPLGSYVPRGDTPANITGIFPPPGVHHSERVGIWVYHQDETYLMATCGHDSTVHKHCDDTQLYVMHKGAEIFTDGGYHSYDYTDPRVRALRTPPAHSVATWIEEHELTPHKAFLHEGGIVDSALHSSETGDRVTMTSSREDGAVIQRTVTVETPRRIVVDDAWNGGRGRTPEATFLLAAPTDVQLTDDHARFTLDGVTATLRFDTQTDVTVHTGGEGGTTGWRSTENGVLFPTTRLVVRPRRRRARPTRLRTIVTLES